MPLREGHRMLFGDADIVYRSGKRCSNSTRPEPSRIAGVMPITRGSSSAASHSHSPNTCVYVLRPGCDGLDALDRIELAGPVIEHRFGLGELVTLPLARDDVEELAGP